MLKITIFLTVLLFGNIQYGISQVDNYQKNKNASEEAEAAYYEDLKKNPNSALPHWKYANVMAEFKSNAYKNAWEYYLKALDVDSTKADIYYDFSNYLANKLNEVDYARLVCEKGLKFAPENDRLKDNLKKFSQIIEKNNENIRHFSFDKTDKRMKPHNMEYLQLSNIDSLNKIVTAKKRKFKYVKLLKKFNDSNSLTDYEVYLMLIGYTQTENYNPYNYNAIDNIYQLAINGQIDQAIKEGDELFNTNPLNPSLNRVLMYCYRKKGNNEKAEYYHKRILAVFNAMLYTGQGTCEKPYITFWVKEEYNFARYIGLSPTGQYSTGMCAGGMADKLETYNTKTEEKETIHFNIMPIFKNAMKKQK